MAGELRVGARVRVVLEGEVQHAGCTVVRVGYVDAEGDNSTLWATPEQCEVLPEPIKVGDIIRQVNDLPVGTVLVELTGPDGGVRDEADLTTWTKTQDGWFATSKFWRGAGLAEEALLSGCFLQVLRVGA